MSTNLKYPYAWARPIVNAFVERYPRGTYFLSKILEVAPGMIRHGLIMCLCRGKSLRFESVKKVVKAFDQMEERDFNAISPSERKLLYKWYLFIAEDEALDEKIARDVVDTVRQRNLLS